METATAVWVLLISVFFFFTNHSYDFILMEKYNNNYNVLFYIEIFFVFSFTLSDSQIIVTKHYTSSITTSHNTTAIGTT